MYRPLIHLPRGLHNPDTRLRSRVFYLFHRFIKEDRNEIPVDLSGTIIESIRDLLVVQVEVPELEEGDQDILTEAVNSPSVFDAQLYLFETVGALVSIFYKTPDQASALLSSVVKPLLEDLSVNLQAVKGPEDVLHILQVHHAIMALGNVAKGFPDYPSPLPEGYIGPPLEVFSQVAQAILVSLEAMNRFRVVRDAVGAFSFHSHGLDSKYYSTDTLCIRSYSCNDWTKCHSSHPPSHGQPLGSF